MMAMDFFYALPHRSAKSLSGWRCEVLVQRLQERSRPELHGILGPRGKSDLPKAHSKALRDRANESDSARPVCTVSLAVYMLKPSRNTRSDA